MFPCLTSAPWIRSDKAASPSTGILTVSPRTVSSSRMAHRSPLTPWSWPPDTEPPSGDLLVGWEDVCDSSGTPTVSGAPTVLGGLYFCGMYVSPAGMLREIGIEATRIATHISR